MEFKTIELNTLTQRQLNNAYKSYLAKQRATTRAEEAQAIAPFCNLVNRLTKKQKIEYQINALFELLAYCKKRQLNEGGKQ